MGSEVISTYYQGMTLKYKGYEGTVEHEEKGFYGKVLDIKDLILYEGDTLEELCDDFIAGIDHYLECCADEGREPNKPQKPEQHDKIAV